MLTLTLLLFIYAYYVLIWQPILFVIEPEFRAKKKIRKTSWFSDLFFIPDSSDKR